MGLVPAGLGVQWPGGVFPSAAQAPAGTALAPAYAFSSSVSDGFWSPGAGILSATLAGVQAMRWSSSGVTSASTVSAVALAVSNGAFLQAQVADFRTNLVVISLDTRANASGQTTGELRIVFQASGISLMYSSGKSSYMIAGSAQSVLQA